jgi:DNA repair exonuclease SbcCD ATPase subunit
MNHVYAKRIDISNFRAFGANFSLSIPPRPGLVIVYGMNGLGKTTFFEAIEWLLTGDVRRIRSAMPARSQLV